MESGTGVFSGNTAMTGIMSTNFSAKAKAHVLLGSTVTDRWVLPSRRNASDIAARNRSPWCGWFKANQSRVINMPFLSSLPPPRMARTTDSRISTCVRAARRGPIVLRAVASTAATTLSRSVAAITMLQGSKPAMSKVKAIFPAGTREAFKGMVAMGMRQENRT